MEIDRDDGQVVRDIEREAAAGGADGAGTEMQDVLATGERFQHHVESVIYCRRVDARCQTGRFEQAVVGQRDVEDVRTNSESIATQLN